MNSIAGYGNRVPITTRQGLMTGLASAAGVFTGAFVVGQLARKGFDIDSIDEAVLDASISIAGSIGIGLADVFSYGAEVGLDALQRIGTTHVNRLNQAGEP